MNPVSVIFNQTSEELVSKTVIRIYTHFDDKNVPALAKISVFQKKMYDPFILKMLEHKNDMLSVMDWDDAFSHVGSIAVKDDTKAAF